MKFIIDEDVVSNNNLSLQEFLAALAVKIGIDFTKTLQSLEDKEVVVKTLFGNYAVTQHWNDIIENILLTSEKSIPKDDDLAGLAEQMMAIMPQCKKEGTKFFFKCNKREVLLKLKKFTKLYGHYSQEDILTATRKYVESFNGNYSYMRILKYFIMKEEKKIDSEGKAYIEEVSELATMLENKDSADSSHLETGELI